MCVWQALAMLQEKLALIEPWAEKQIIVGLVLQWLGGCRVLML